MTIRPTDGAGTVAGSAGRLGGCTFGAGVGAGRGGVGAGWAATGAAGLAGAVAATLAAADWVPSFEVSAGTAGFAVDCADDDRPGPAAGAMAGSVTETRGPGPPTGRSPHPTSPSA